MYEITETQNVTRTKNGGVLNPSQNRLKYLSFFQNSDNRKTSLTVLCCFYLSTNVTISADISYLKALYDCKAIVSSTVKWTVKWVLTLRSFSSFIGSISAALSCLVYPPREETAGRVSGKVCLWRKFLIKILAVLLVVRNVIWWQSLAGSHDAYGS